MTEQSKLPDSTQTLNSKAGLTSSALQRQREKKNCVMFEYFLISDRVRAAASPRSRPSYLPHVPAVLPLKACKMQKVFSSSLASSSKHPRRRRRRRGDGQASKRSPWGIGESPMEVFTGRRRVRPCASFFFSFFSFFHWGMRGTRR